MSNICLETKNKEQEVLKTYLEQNASETLIEKINNGVKIQKEGKTLINKKTLETFMKYACDEARKQAEKGANSAMVEDKVVFGWLIHYFEEDSIEGVLYNEDGTEYKKASIKKVVTDTKPVTKPIVKTTPKNNQETISMFDDEILEKIASTENKVEEPETDETEEPETDEELADEIEIEEHTNAPSYEQIENSDALVCVETGEVIGELDFDMQIVAKLYEIFGNEMEGC